MLAGRVRREALEDDVLSQDSGCRATLEAPSHSYHPLFLGKECAGQGCWLLVQDSRVVLPHYYSCVGLLVLVGVI